MTKPIPELLIRTEPPCRDNGERRLAHDYLFQIMWFLVAAAGGGQLFLLVWLDVMF
jgi:hypothetical protein